MDCNGSTIFVAWPLFGKNYTAQDREARQRVGAQALPAVHRAMPLPGHGYALHGGLPRFLRGVTRRCQDEAKGLLETAP